MWQETPRIRIRLTSPELCSIDAQFKQAKNYYDLYSNIRRAVFNILDDNIDDALKVLNDPMLGNHKRCSTKSQ